MKSSRRFSGLGGSFWAHVKFVSERLGYSVRRKKDSKVRRLRRFSIDEIVQGLEDAGLRSEHIQNSRTGKPTLLGRTIREYLNHRAATLEKFVRPRLMSRAQAAGIFKKLKRSLKPKCSLPMNKQKGKKRHPAYLTGIVNMLTEKELGRRAFNDDPKGLILFTRMDRPIGLLSRWMDGAYPAIVNPRAVWEVKEYYGTKTFGSRVADGVYESLLDGMELEQLRVSTGRRVRHYLIVDDKFTWWDCGRSYLCRIFDMLHAGLVDEVLFGREVLERWPKIVRAWS